MTDEEIRGFILRQTPADQERIRTVAVSLAGEEMARLEATSCPNHVARRALWRAVESLWSIQAFMGEC